MNKILLLALVAASLVAVHAQTCTEVKNCDSCSNPGPLCEDCLDKYVLSQDRTKCLACGTGCEKCTSDASDVVTCTECDEGYYMDAGACTTCGTGCLECHMDTAGALVCDKCNSIGYTQDMTTAAQPCVACDSKCMTCSLQTDGTTKCSECYSYQGLGQRGYFLKTSDSSCGTCPSNCEKCTDNGSGKGICTSCYSSYVILVDENDSTNDGTKCVRCATECATCSGVEVSSGTATCESCKPNLGLYLSAGACTSCDANCDTCDDDGLCTECKVDYRVDSGACTACPAFCESCSVDVSTGVESCDTCDSTYGSKDATSVTCDSCGISNCQTCSRGSNGVFSCSACKSGYGFDADNKCASCSTGCSTCEWDSTYMKCTDCLAGYTDDVYPTSASSTAGTPSACTVCPTECATCNHVAADGSMECLSCADTTTHFLDSSGSADACTTLPANCASATAATGVCATCANGYRVDSNACAQCTATFCTQCVANAAICDACLVGYGPTDSDSDGNNDNCVACDISRCEACNIGTPNMCTQCNSGYVHYDANEGANKATEGGACKSCPNGCDTCTVDYSTSNDATVCTSSGCKAWDGTRAYAYNGDGGCVQCPSKCQDCDYDSATQTTSCKSGQCVSTTNSKVTLNDDSGECEACPDNCNACEYDSATSSIVCSDNQCKPGYGKISDGSCNECPSNCDTCNINTGTDADDTLFCSNTGCTTNYASNSDVCAKCPSNCATCTDSSGTMTCTACKSGYAADTSGSCTKCPTNCKSCTATGTLTCQECNTGYALAGDKLSCIMCSTAAFDNCAECGNVNATTDKAECDKCSSGYTLIDEEDNIGCVSTSSLSCNGAKSVDNGPECSTCSSGFTQTYDMECGIQCYKCGDIGAGEFVDQSSCQIPQAGQNATEGFATMEMCTIGSCYAALVGGKVQSGCLPPTFNGGICGTTFMDTPQCSDTDNVQLCVQCCNSELCNSFVATMQESSAVSMATSALLVAVCAFFSLRF